MSDHAHTPAGADDCFGKRCKCGSQITGRMTRCAPCNRAAVREWRAKNRERAAELDRRSRYGLEPEAYDAMLAAQGGRCAICGTTDWGGRSGSPHVDHDHATGRVRGLLCCHCNLALGHAGDDPARLRALADYLERVLVDA